MRKRLLDDYGARKHVPEPLAKLGTAGDHRAHHVESDSVDNAKREMAIIRVEENNFKPLIENFYRRT